MSRVGAVLLALAAFVLGAMAQRLYDVRRTTSSSSIAPSESASLTATPVPFAAIQFDHEPLWAYGFERPPKPGEKASPQLGPNQVLAPSLSAEERTRPRHIAGSSAAFSLMDIRDIRKVTDWFPGDHPPMPDVIAHGPRLAKVHFTCPACHLPNGKGRPENAPLSGLPVAYILRQLQDFRDGLRYSADPRKQNTNTMIGFAKAMTGEELKAAAAYFSAIPFTPWVRVIETNLVPRTRIEANLFLPIEEERTEPIAGRIIEVPEDQEQSETYRNPHSGFLAYVPIGSISKGQDLVTTGGMRVSGDHIVQGKTTACGTCHGPDLRGVGDVPAIAGRSPSYMVRQLWDMQQGTRHGVSSQLMQVVVANLSEEDLVAIAAYVASRSPTAN
jgi:cytochrome c553